jgi:hypothetical protein
MLSVQDRQVSNLEHARWRVAFRQSMYDAHLTLAHGSEEWLRKEQEYLQWLKRAKADLYSLEHPRSPPLPPEFRRDVSMSGQGSSSIPVAGTARDSVTSNRR